MPACAGIVYVLVELQTPLVVPVKELMLAGAAILLMEIQYVPVTPQLFDAFTQRLPFVTTLFPVLTPTVLEPCPLTIDIPVGTVQVNPVAPKIEGVV
jgi:hypothetical protein